MVPGMTDDRFSKQNYITESSKAIPMPIVTKKRIIEAQDLAHEARSTFREYDNDRDLKELKQRVSDFYNLVWIYIDDLPRHKKGDYKNLEEIVSAPIEVENKKEEFKEWSERLYKLDMLLKDLGITDIGIKMEETDFAYSIFKGTPFNGFERPNTQKEASNWVNWYKLLSAIRTYAIKLKEDTDGLIVIWGPNRTGKDTLGLQLTQEVNPKPLTERNIVFNDDDFYEATEELNKFSAFHVTELSSLFYSKDAMKSEQKMRKKKLKTYAKKNMLMIGCDLNFYNLDKELISDKVTAAIHIPNRGKFEYYNKEKIKKFEKDRDTGEVVTPAPVFKGKFPKLEGRIWEMYKKMEDKKVINKDEGEEESKKIKDMAKEVREKLDRYKKEYHGRKYIDKDLVASDFEIGDRKSKKVKKLVEADEDMN